MGEEEIDNRKAVEKEFQEERIRSTKAMRQERV